MTRLFVAAWPPPDLAGRLRALFATEEPGVRPVPHPNLHVTLRFLGDADGDEVAGRLAACSLPAATASIGPLVQRLGSGQLVLPVSGVDAIAAAVDGATDGIGAPRRHEFFGHVTLARTRRGARSVHEGLPTTASFPVEDVRLVESRLDPGGSVYTTVATVRVG